MPFYDLEKGEKIKILCKLGLVEEGEVVSFTDNYLKLDSLTKTVIINNPNENILSIVIFKEKKEEQVFIDEDLELEEEIRDPNKRAVALAELYKERASEERDRAKRKLTEFSVKNINIEEKNHFGYPSFAKPISNDTSEKT